MIAHLLGCADPSTVRVTTGLTKNLLHCASCGAETWVLR